MSKDSFQMDIEYYDSKSVKILVITKYELLIHIEIFQFLIRHIFFYRSYKK